MSLGNHLLRNGLKNIVIIAGLNQCKLLSCSHGQDCEIDKQGITNCVCSQTCQPVVRPICANNGKTYDNLCEMERYGCIDRVKLVAKYFGNCGKLVVLRTDQ